MSKTIGVFAGSASSFNVSLAASNIGQALSENFTAHLISTDGEFATTVEDSFDEIYGISNGRSLWGEIAALRSYLKSERPDVLFQITSPPIHGTTVGVLARSHGIPFVYRYSGDRFYEHRLSKGLEKIFHFGLNNVFGRIPLRLADKYIALGPTGVCRLEDRGVDRSDVSIIPPAVKPDRFSGVAQAAEFDTDRHIGLFVGRLSDRKGKKTLERALPRILEKRSDLEFVFIGNQPDSLDLPPKYMKHVTLVGPVAPEHVPQYYSAADFVIHPSLTEGLPRAVLEALASDTPPIARNIGDIPFATENTFDSEMEFVDRVCNFESLETDPIQKFLPETTTKKYIGLFQRFEGE